MRLWNGLHRDVDVRMGLVDKKLKQFVSAARDAISLKYRTVQNFSNSYRASIFNKQKKVLATTMGDLRTTRRGDERRERKRPLCSGNPQIFTESCLLHQT